MYQILLGRGGQQAGVVSRRLRQVRLRLQAKN